MYDYQDEYRYPDVLLYDSSPAVTSSVMDSSDTHDSDEDYILSNETNT